MQKYRNYKLAMKLGNSRACEKPYKLLGALCFYLQVKILALELKHQSTGIGCLRIRYPNTVLNPVPYN